MKLTFPWLALLSLMLALPALAQERNPFDPSLRTQIDAARNVLEKQKRLVLASELNLGREERDKFWDLYAEYAEDLRKVNDKRVDVIVRYAQNYDQMTDALARELLDEQFRWERDLLKLRERYRKRLQRILPDIKVARFFQVEAKLDAALDYNLASRIPIIQEPQGQQ